jgi:hypothetical protein
VAVKKGFEPLIRFLVYTLSRRAPSTTRTLHRFLFKPFSLSRRANLVEDLFFGKHFFQFFHAFKPNHGKAEAARAKPPISPALLPHPAALP